MIKMFLFFSHRLSEDQIKEAQDLWKIDIFMYLPNCLQEKWSNIDPSLEEINVNPFTGWIEANAKENDIFLVQGDFGATYNLVKYLKDKDRTVVYSTTQRDCIEQKNKNNTTEIIHQYRHVRFRSY